MDDTFVRKNEIPVNAYVVKPEDKLLIVFPYTDIKQETIAEMSDAIQKLREDHLVNTMVVAGCELYLIKDGKSISISGKVQKSKPWWKFW
jgi:hypothetical protein